MIVTIMHAFTLQVCRYNVGTFNMAVILALQVGVLYEVSNI